MYQQCKLPGLLLFEIKFRYILAPQIVIPGDILKPVE